MSQAVIVCAGDSITKGRVWAPGLKPKIIKDSFPCLLGRMLDGCRVFNCGVTNNTSVDLLDRLENDIISQTPDYVIIEIGGNDCNFHWNQVAANPDHEHQPAVDLGDFRDNIFKILGIVRDSGSFPILSTLPPLDPARYYAFLRNSFSDAISKWICLKGGIYSWQEEYSRLITDIATSTGTILADIRSAFLNTSDYRFLISEDGIHPNPMGHQLMSGTFARILAGLGLPLKPR